MLYLHINQRRPGYTGSWALPSAQVWWVLRTLSRSQNRTLELNSREWTWREWVSFCPKCRGSPKLRWSWVLVREPEAPSGEQPVLGISIPAKSHLLRARRSEGPAMSSVSQGLITLDPTLAMEEATLLPGRIHGPSSHRDTAAVVLSIIPVA